MGATKIGPTPPKAESGPAAGIAQPGEDAGVSDLHRGRSGALIEQ